MNPAQCLINLQRLKDAELSTGYSQKGLKDLFGSTSVIIPLTFTRRQFIQQMPARQQGMSISGYQPKLSLCLNEGELQVVNNHGTYILKPSPEEYPHLAENEHATMTMMARLKFVVPPFGLIRFKADETGNDELALVVKRYDRNSENNTRIHQEQLDGAMGISDKYGYVNGKKNVSYQRAAKFLNQQVSHSLKSKRDVFLRILYAYVLGNNDFHLRNLGILHPENSFPVLAPVYDFISVVPYPAVFREYLALPLLESEENDITIAPGIDSKYGEYLGLDFILLAQGMDINPKLAKKWLSEVVKNHPLIIETYTESHMPEQQRNAVLTYVAKRMALLAVTEL